jgi:hypothetical protein
MIKNFIKLNEDKLKIWIEKNYFKIGLFNVILIMLVLLRSAGYFEPFFPITINFIVLLALLLAIVLLGLGSKFMFLTSLTFWVLAATIKLAGVDIWAERTAIYAYQAVVLGVLLLIREVSSSS